MDADPWMHRCCITDTTIGKIDWHHNLIHAGSQVNEAWCILPLHEDVHDKMTSELKERLDWIMLNRTDEDTLAYYSRAINYIRRRDILNRKYGKYTRG